MTTRTEFEAAALRDVADWHRKEAGHCRYAANTTAMDKKALVSEPLNRKADMHEGFARTIAAAMGWPTVPEKGG